MRRRNLAGGLALLTLPYLTYVAATWHRYGRARAQPAAGPSSPLDRFMPAPEVAERRSKIGRAAAVSPL